jgi:hypothetical protein
MKSFRTAVAVLALMMASGFWVSIRAQSGYSLVCRGGALTAVLQAGSLIYTYQADHTSKVTASTQPGFCSWVDRAMGLTEPSRTTQRIPAGSSIIVSYDGTRQVKTLTVPAQANWLNVLKTSSGWWRFCGNSVGGYLSVVDSGSISGPTGVSLSCQ